MRILRTNGIVLLMACGLAIGAHERPIYGGTGQGFEAVTVHSGLGPVFGLALGEFDRTNPGPELACLLETSSVVELVPGGPAWSGEVIFEADDRILSMTERPTIDIGDVVPETEGEEVVVLGVDKGHVVFRNTDGVWDSELVFDGSDLIGDYWGARAGDYDPERPGEEILAIHEGGADDQSSAFVFDKVDGSWRELLVYSREVGMDSVAGEFDPDHSGPEIFLVTEVEPAYEIFPASSYPDLWPLREVWSRYDTEDAGWVVKIGDVDPLRSGNEIAVGTRYSNRIMVSSHTGSGPHRLETALTGSQTEIPRNMWDIALGDVFPGVGNLEIVGVDESGRVYLAWHDGRSWQDATVWRDPSGPLHSVVVGDFVASAPGEEILVAGASGTVTLLSRSNLQFLRSDCNDDGAVDISDPVYTLGALFLGDGDPGCNDACDSNDDGKVDVADPITTLGILFYGFGRTQPVGVLDCSVDSTLDALGCDAFQHCPR